MSLFDDSRLQGYQRELKKLVQDQSKFSTEVTRLRTKMNAELDNIQRSYKREIEIAERSLETTTRSLPDAQRRVESRQEELTRESQNKAASTNSAPTEQRKSSW